MWNFLYVTFQTVFSWAANIFKDLLESTETMGIFIAGILGFIVIRFFVFPLTGNVEFGSGKEKK